MQTQLDTSQEAEEQEVTLTVWAWDSDFYIPILLRAEEYFRLDGYDEVTLKIEHMYKQEILRSLVEHFEEDNIEGLPNIVLVEDEDIPFLLSQYSQHFVDLSDAMSFSHFAPFKVAPLTNGEEKYGVPFTSGTLGLFYQKELLTQAGYTPEQLDDITWNELIDMGKSIKEESGLFLFPPLNDRFGEWVQMLARSASSGYFDTSGNLNLLKNPAINKASHILFRLKEEGLIPTEEESMQENEPFDAYAMRVDNVRFNMEASIIEEPEKWGYTSLPKLETEGATSYSTAGGTTWMVLYNTPNKQIATTFLKEEFAGNPEFYQEIFLNYGTIASYMPVLDEKSFTMMDAPENQKDIFRAFSDWTSYVPVIRYGVHHELAKSGIQKYFGRYMDNELSLTDMLEKADAYVRKESE